MDQKYDDFLILENLHLNQICAILFLLGKNLSLAISQWFGATLARYEVIHNLAITMSRT